MDVLECRLVGFIFIGDIDSGRSSISINLNLMPLTTETVKGCIDVQGWS
jgi:hypothetical protein